MQALNDRKTFLIGFGFFASLPGLEPVQQLCASAARKSATCKAPP